MDERLLIEAAQSDPTRFGELYEENFARVYAFIARRVRNRQEAQDLTSQVFERALANIGRFEWRGTPFAAWLYRMAANAIADHYHALSRELHVPRTPDVAGDETERIELRTLLSRSIDKLPAEQRRVVTMRFLEERSIREIAEKLGKSEGAIKQLQWRALQKLRADMNHG
ncbi:MAG TPA: RNA polymerase sigma factor [Thermoanaerobaculia bacterium]|nr:RNA polymerase sigma factor [Thermoanaerobaculia bacterium]